MEAHPFAGALTLAISSMLSTNIQDGLRQAGASKVQLQTMTKKILSIQEFLKDVRNTRQGVNTESITLQLNHWCKKVNDLTFYVENTIDKNEYETVRRNNRSSFKKTSLLSLAFCMSRRISKILSLLDELEKETAKMDTMRGRTVNVTAPRYCRNNSDPLDQTFKFEGRKTDEETIVEKLLSSDDAGGYIFTIAVVGMGGIGKTSLAKKVYEDQRILDHFAKKFWVTVGEIFDATKILKEMLQSVVQVPRQEEDSSDTEVLVDFIQGEKTLIVLDDVWSVKREQLHKLYGLHSGGNKISILVTTRRKEAASTISASYVHNLERLQDEESWDLFKLVVGAAEPMKEDCDFETYGREIVAKCHGVPLIIRNMGGLLQRKANVLQWKTVAETRLRDLPSFEILSTLSMTYDRLPNTVKQCFAYCSIFPKGATIRKSDLIRLWLAQGFLTEEAAEKYFDILLNELLLQVSNQDDDGNAIECTMLDLNHDLAMHVSRHEGLIFDGQEDAIENQPGSVSSVQHLLISPGVMEEARESHFRLRTMYSMVEFNAVQETLLSQAKYMYVLKLDGIGLKEVPKSIGKLKFLRYLDLSNNPIRYLPETITHLYLLQTLLLVNCEGLEQPQGLKNLINLTLVDASPLQLPSQMVPLTARRIQPPIKLDEKGGSKKISDLGNLNDISGPLYISGLEYMGNREAAQEAKIGMKHGLSALELHWNRERLETGDSQHNLDDQILDGLQPHPNIQRLKMINYNSQQFPMWVKKMKGEGNERLNKLVKIELVDCKRCLQLPTLGQLPSLWTLIVGGMDNIETIGQEFYSNVDDSEEKDVLEVYFPFLRRLELRNFSRLINWLPSTTGQMIDNNICQAFPRLETLKVVDCPQLKSIPTDFPQMKSLMIQGITWGSWLETIIINSCKNHRLTSLVLCKMVFEPDCFCNELFWCTSLEELSLQKCKKLGKWPARPWNLTSLKELCINDCPLLRYLPRVDDLTALNTLVIRGCERLTEAPKYLGMCSSLTKLAITDCKLLTKIPDLQRLTSLEELDILDCVKLKSLPEGLDNLTSLRTVRIGEVCDSFTQFPECESLKNLERVWLKGTSKGSNMIDLPEQLKCLPQLKVLRIWRFSSLETVPAWICDLKDLEIMIFEECDTLKELPSRRDMRKLKKLRCLRIEKCANLEERFEKGLEWENIRHVSHIKIKGRWYQGDRSSLLQEITEPELDHIATNIDDEEPNDGYRYYDAEEEPGRKSTRFYILVSLWRIGIIILQSFLNFLQKLDEASR